MKRVVSACALLLVFSLLWTQARAESFTGTWSITPSDKAGMVQLRMDYRRVSGSSNEEWSQSDDVPVAELHRQGNGFTLTRDAGQFRAVGVFNGNQGAGTWTFVPSSTFAQELQRRGVGTPTEKEQFELAIGAFKLATVDTLLQSGFQRPSPSDLIRLTEHGVSNDYLNAMKGLRFQPKTIDELVRLRDHGVDPAYAQNMLRRAPQLSAEDLIELRDHGVSNRFMEALSNGGYGNVSPSDAERMMDHGVSAAYLAGLRRLGYHPGPDDLVKLVDHGVSISFIERMRSHGYAHLTVDDLIRLRDHGF
jgi:hypothetical protein